MFGIKIINEQKYRSEKKAVDEIVALNDELVKKNARLELDIKGLREQNTKLRSINAKRKDENEHLVERIKKLKKSGKFDGEFNLVVNESPSKCSVCKHENENCKKLIIGGREVCVIAEPSFC